MLLLLWARRKLLCTIGFTLLLTTAPSLFAQGALLLEQPYGVFGTLNPTGHAAVYLERVCAETPVKLRMCDPGETGIVISRYKGLAGYDWVAIPLIPYLYSVDDPTKVPTEVDEETVTRLREHYKEARLGDWGDDLPKGSFFNGGWTQLVGTAYDRRTYAFRFATTAAQDERLVAALNASRNHSRFNILFNNCADFDRSIMNFYFPHKFRRTIFPDAGITTPKRVAYQLVKYAKRHPDAQLTVLEIPQVPGFRRNSRAIHGVAETFFTNGYVIPVIILNPYVAGGLLADYLVRGRYTLVPKNPTTVNAENIHLLTGSSVFLSSESQSQPVVDSVDDSVGDSLVNPAATAVPAPAPALTTAPTPARSEAPSLTQPVPESENPFNSPHKQL